MMGSIDERPELSGGSTFGAIGSKQANAHTEQNASAKLERLHLLDLPWKWLEQW